MKEQKLQAICHKVSQDIQKQFVKSLKSQVHEITTSEFFMIAMSTMGNFFISVLDNINEGGVGTDNIHEVRLSIIDEFSDEMKKHVRSTLN